MTRWLRAAVLTCLLLGLPGLINSVTAQAAPSAGELRTLEIEDGRYVSLSPDGTRLAAVVAYDALCLFDAQSFEQLVCGDLQANDIRIRLEDIRWSPDSSTLAFGEDAYRLGADGDLWVMDAFTGELTNLTDDGYSGSMFAISDDSSNESTFYVDVAPAWTPDSRFITFSRSGFVLGERTGNELAQVPAAGGEVETLATVSPGEPGIVYFGAGWDASGATFYYSITHSELDNPENGIWTYDAVTGATVMLAGSDDPELGPLTLLQVSPTGDQLLGWYPQAFGQMQVQEPFLRLIDTATGEQTPVESPAPDSDFEMSPAFGTFSPDGQALLVLLNEGDGVSTAWVQDLQTGDWTQVLDGLEQAYVEPGLTLGWGTNGTIAFGKMYGAVYVSSIEGIGLDLTAVATPAASPIASPVAGTTSSGVPVGGEVRAVELPDGRAVSMSPDGHYLAVAVLPQESLCVYDVATMAEVSCADLSVLNTSLRVEDVVWSPDSTRLAFSEQTFITFKDGDLWVMDAASGELTDITDDGYDGAILFLEDDADDVPFYADVAPAWTPDSQFITFSRTLSGEGGVLNNVVAQVSAEGGEVETLAEVGDAPGIFYYRAQWSPDGQRFYYSVAYPDLDNDQNGIWVYDKATGEAALLAVSDDPEFGTLVLREVSPAGDRLLAYYPMAQYGGYVNRSTLRFADPLTGELSSVPDPAPESEIFEGTWIATFSPDGQYLLQAVGMDASARDFWATNLATGESARVASALEGAVPIEYALGPVWGTDGTVFVSWNVTGAYFFPIEGAGTGPIASAATATPESGTAPFAPGSTAITNGMTPVFAAPDANASVVNILVPNRPVEILSAPVQNDQGTWYPVRDPDTQIIGYVQASRLE